MNQSNPTPSTKELHNFGLIFGIIFVVVGFLMHHASISWGLFGLAAAFIFFALASPRFLSYIYVPWMKFAKVLGNFNARIIFTLMYFILVLPFGIVVRFTTDFLSLKPSKQPTRWLEHTKSNQTTEDYLNQG